LTFDNLSPYQGCNTNAFGFGYGDGTRWLGTGPVKLAADVWQHVAIVCDGRHAIMYVNGVQKSKRPANRPLAINPYQRFRLGLGYKPGFGRCVHGLLQDVRIYRRALSAAGCPIATGVKRSQPNTETDRTRKATAIRHETIAGLRLCGRNWSATLDCVHAARALS
jgi:hypothetical protein